MERRLFVGGALLLAAGAAAQRVEVRKSGEGKISISLAAMRAGGDAASQTFLAVLRADLARSGYFALASGAAEISVAGSCTGGANLRAECQVSRTATRERLLGKAYSAPATDARSLAHRVADEILFAVTGRRGMASGRIALVSNRTGRKELYVCDMDGKNLRQVTNDRSIVVGPRWAPDARNIVYTSYKRGYPNVYLTGRARPLSSHAGLNVSGAIAPDGGSMAVILSKDGNPELYVKSLRTGATRRLTETRRANEASPCWSPDGNHIAYVSDTTGTPQVYILSKDGGTPQRLTSSGSENVSPDWSPNGYIAFSSRIGGRYRIAISSPAARTLKVLETDWADYEDPSWAPDGRHIVCSRTSARRSSIYLLDTFEDSPVALVSGSEDWYSPSCTP